MICPKCRRELHIQSEICSHCGIVFAKYFKYHPEEPDQQGYPPPVVTIVEEDEAKPLTQFLFHEMQQSTPAKFLGRSLIFAGLLIWSWLLMSASIESNTAGNSF